MVEKHEYEQYFWTPDTVQELSDFAQAYSAPCCLCAPMLGAELAKRNVPVTILDRDERFAGVKGFQAWNLYRPTPLAQQFDLIICDPPFYSLSLSQLFRGLRVLAQHDFAQKMLIGYLKRRETNVLGTFGKFGINPTGYTPKYVTVDTSSQNRIEFYGNLTP